MLDTQNILLMTCYQSAENSSLGIRHVPITTKNQPFHAVIKHLATENCGFSLCSKKMQSLGMNCQAVHETNSRAQTHLYISIDATKLDAWISMLCMALLLLLLPRLFLFFSVKRARAIDLDSHDNWDAKPDRKI